MENICLGIMINIFYQERTCKAARIYDVCRKNFAAFNCNMDGYDKIFQSLLKLVLCQEKVQISNDIVH